MTEYEAQVVWEFFPLASASEGSTEITGLMMRWPPNPARLAKEVSRISSVQLRSKGNTRGTCRHTDPPPRRGTKPPPMGARNFNKVDATPLHGGKIIAVVDKDTDGQAWAEQVEQQLDGMVQCLAFKQAKEGKDLTDHITAGHSLDELEPWQPPADQTAPVPGTSRNSRNSGKWSVPRTSPLLSGTRNTYSST